MLEEIHPPLLSANQYPSLALLQKWLVGKELPFWNKCQEAGLENPSVDGHQCHLG